VWEDEKEGLLRVVVATREVILGVYKGRLRGRPLEKDFTSTVFRRGSTVRRVEKNCGERWQIVAKDFSVLLEVGPRKK